MSNGLILNHDFPADFYKRAESFSLVSSPMSHQMSFDSNHSGSSRGSSNAYFSCSREREELYWMLSQQQQHPRFLMENCLPSQYEAYDPSYGGHQRSESSQHRRDSAQSPDRDKKPQYCLYPSCRDLITGLPNRSFSRKADMNRHFSSTHEKKYIDCPLQNCDRKGERGFTRIDHLMEHRRGSLGEALPKRGGSGGGSGGGSKKTTEKHNDRRDDCHDDRRDDRISTHERKFIDCPRWNCDRKGERGFTRIDHLMEHRRGYHGEALPKRGASGGGSKEATEKRNDRRDNRRDDRRDDRRRDDRRDSRHD